MKKDTTIIILLFIIVALIFIGLVVLGNGTFPFHLPTSNSKTLKVVEPMQSTIGTRVLLPQGFTRTATDNYGEYIRNLPLLPDKSPVLLYNGIKKLNQSSHIAVVDIDVGKKDLQQCADSALRIRTEYLFQTQQFDKINYHLTNGELFSYTDYRDGYRLKVEGNNTSLVKTDEYSDTYETFRGYLEILFIYAGTISVENESTPLPKEEMQIGDVFVIGGSPGHCIMVVDLCENIDGEKMFLLAQGNTPAQQIHLLKNNDSQIPWYSLSDLEYPFKLSRWTFGESSLRRMP